MRTALKLLITGGTTFVSRFTAAWFVRRGDEVYVLNRGTREQIEGVRLIQADRHALDGVLKGCHFDAVLDICAYNEQDVNALLDGLDGFTDYILISSSAVYPETNARPFREEQAVGRNRVWGSYGLDKIGAEQTLARRCPQAYILRPPYLYGPMQNIYREPFVFDCALAGRSFYIPGDGTMGLQFFHVADLCWVMEAILTRHPEDHVLNVGNLEAVDVKTFVAECYEAVGCPLRMVFVPKDAAPQRSYFCFHDYDCLLDTTKQQALLPKTIPLSQGLRESWAWYEKHRDDVVRRPYMTYIDTQLRIN